MIFFFLEVDISSLNSYYIDMPLKIIRKEKVKKNLSYSEVRDQKSIEPYKTNRQTSKTLNFLLIYGGSASILASECLELNWTMDQCRDYVKSEHLENDIKELKLQPGSRFKDEDDIIRMVCATRLRENYFKGYEGFLTRGDKEIQFATQHGYVRSYFGATRKLIELALKGTDDVSRKSREIRNLENICRNTAIQNLESCIVKKAMCNIQKFTEEKNLKSYVWNEIHDSVDFVVYKPELHDVLAHTKHVMERAFPETKYGLIPLKIDVEVSDLNKGDYYKGGREPAEFGIEWEGLEYEDPDPFYIETTREFEEKYFRGRRDYWRKKNQKDPLEDEIAKYLEEGGLSID